MRARSIAWLPGLLLAACTSGEPEAPAEPAEQEAAGEEAAEEAAEEAEAPAEEAAAEPEAAADEEPAADSFENGALVSQRFNIQMRVPESWRMASNGEGGPAGLGTSDDSLTLIGPGEDGLRLVVANSESIQLVDASFANLTESIGFDNVRIHPDRSQTRTFNGVPGYRTEADALLRGDRVPVYIVAQALELPGEPTMVTAFVNGDKYDIHEETMFAILDSIEPLNLRGE